MGFKESVRDEQARERLVSAPAAGFLHGEVGATERYHRWVRPLRFSDEQIRALGSVQAWHPGLYRQMARTTAGICIEFETDAREVALEVWPDAEPKATRAVLAEVERYTGTGWMPHDGISADVERHHIACRMPAEREGVLFFSLGGHDPEDALGLQPLPGMGRNRHVRIWLPALRGCQIRDLMCDGTYLHQVPRRKALLVLGDSIAQGFVSGDPAFAWPTLLATRLDLDVVNQGVGGQVFQPGTLFGFAGLVDPARIIVAFGENYRYEPCMARRISRDIRSYLLEVSRLWPHVPTQVITPLWHDEEASPSHPMSCYEQLPSFLSAHCAPHDQMTLIDGMELLDHDPELLADGYEHPNLRGNRQIATRLNAVIRVPGLRPSSVGKRRRRKTQSSAAEEPLSPNDTIAIPFDELIARAEEQVHNE